uniref:Uncharacterized protein n=1 Tax=Opuntia streptacantha TaxID=393608 RepID=A0A7C9E657_OPUST
MIFIHLYMSMINICILYDEHLKRWEEYKNSQHSTTETTQDLSLSECDLWVEANLNKGHVYGLNAERLVMKQCARHSFSVTRSSSVNNYNPREMAQRLNESVYKVAEEARAQEMRQKIEADLTAKLTAQINDEWN